jgi:hypothetical protein
VQPACRILHPGLQLAECSCSAHIAAREGEDICMYGNADLNGTSYVVGNLIVESREAGGNVNSKNDKEIEGWATTERGE